MLSNNFFKIFVTVAATENISLAASLLHYTQGAVSHSISRAEAELGFPLFQRTQKGVVITEDGRSLLPYAKRIVDNLDQADSAIAAIHGLNYGHIKVGTYASISQHFLPELIVDFSSDYPGITIEIVESFYHNLIAMCMDRTIDIAFTTYMNNPDFDQLPLFEDPFVAIFKKGTPVKLDKNGLFHLSELSELNFIMPMEGSKLDPDFRECFGKNLPQFNTHISSLDYISIMCMVKAGLGCSMLPRLITPDYENFLDIYPVYPHKSRVLCMAVRSLSTTSISTLKFIEYTKKYVNERFLPDQKKRGFTAFRTN
ncbi:MAG: LysR family transcriptional regulator [Clostridiales bacterium]|nr:LysR family transcriptional regulator [Clostridiales bacterium]